MEQNNISDAASAGALAEILQHNESSTNNARTIRKCIRKDESSMTCAVHSNFSVAERGRHEKGQSTN